MEVSFKKEIQALRLGDGATFRGEGILAVTKALLESGVSYVGGYQGAPVSHLLDVMSQAEELLASLGVYLFTPVNEAGAAAALGASVNYPMRGAMTWKSIVGTNVAADALSNLASPGVLGGTLIILGEDYGEGASVIQERSHAFALKSSLWLLDPRPDLPTIVNLVRQSFELSEASNTPVMLELRIRACHVFGQFTARDNRRPAISLLDKLPGPASFDYDRLAHPPATFRQEHLKVSARLPAALRFIAERGLNELRPGRQRELGIITVGGLFNSLIQQLMRLDLADPYGTSDLPILVLNVVHPLVPDEIRAFCSGKRAVLVIEEGQPAFIEQALQAELRLAGLATAVHGKDCLNATGEYGALVLLAGLEKFLRAAGMPSTTAHTLLKTIDAHGRAVQRQLGQRLPERPPTFCTGCPERPVFTALKLYQRATGPVHIAADIGCHALATFPPFSSGNTILGYGMSLASAAAVASGQQRRPISIMGDGGFWHNGLTSGVLSSVFNKSDSVLIILDNGYSSATGVQALPSSGTRPRDVPRLSIESMLKAAGVTWLRKVGSYSVRRMVGTLRDAMTSPEPGLKVILATGECQLARQRRVRQERQAALTRGERVVRTVFGIDQEMCTGDHSCIRLSGCPSLSIAPNDDPLRLDPVAKVRNDCVGCGLCGEVAHAAQLCPSFYRVQVIQNPSRWDRLVHRWRAWMLNLLLPRHGAHGTETA